MKNSLKILVGSLALAALTACGGGGGGGGSSDPGTPGAGALGAGNSTQAYLGKGDWNGTLRGQTMTSQQFQMFMYQYGANTGGGFTELFKMRIWSGYTGILPEQMGFNINNGQRMSGDAFINGNGLLINNYQQYGYGGGGYGGGYGQPYYGNQVRCFAYPCNTQQYGVPGAVATGTPVLQISTQFVDACRNTMNVQVRYQGVIVLAGQLSGPVTYDQRYAYGAGGYGAGYGQPGYGQSGYPGYTGTPLAVNVPPQCYTQQYVPQQQPYPY